jgi:hypothetical protein
MLNVDVSWLTTIETQATTLILNSQMSIYWGFFCHQQ